MKTLRNYNRVLLGYNDDQPIYLTPPSWDCGWYWGFGYIGNRNCHYHLDGISNGKNLHTGLVEHFGTTITIRPSDLWTFAELISTFYKLRETAEVLGRGGSHLSSNPCATIITNKVETARINNEVLPAVFDAIYTILDRNKDNKKLFAELVEVDDRGLTIATIEFMKRNSITPDDLKTKVDNKNYKHEYITGVSSRDHNRIHSAYWKDYHANKKLKTQS